MKTSFLGAFMRMRKISYTNIPCRLKLQQFLTRCCAARLRQKFLMLMKFFVVSLYMLNFLKNKTKSKKLFFFCANLHFAVPQIEIFSSSININKNLHIQWDFFFLIYIFITFILLKHFFFFIPCKTRFVKLFN